MDLDLVLEGGRLVTMGMIYASCDVPFTRTLEVGAPIEKVRLHLWHESSFVDSVLLESSDGSPYCHSCSPVYALVRDPPFSGGPGASLIGLTETQYTDR